MRCDKCHTRRKQEAKEVVASLMRDDLPAHKNPFSSEHAVLSAARSMELAILNCEFFVDLLFLFVLVSFGLSSGLSIACVSGLIDGESIYFPACLIAASISVVLLCVFMKCLCGISMRYDCQYVKEKEERVMRILCRKRGILAKKSKYKHCGK